MKTKERTAKELLAEIALVAPSISIKTIWSHDTDCRDIRKDCDGFDDEDPDDWQAWQSEVCATAVVGGALVSGSDYLGGTWEKACDHPAKSNPEISGYYPHMLKEALRELASEVPADSELYFQTQAAINLI